MILDLEWALKLVIDALLGYYLIPLSPLHTNNQVIINIYLVNKFGLVWQY